MPTKTCIVEGCPRRQHGRGFCCLHYQRWKKHGNPLPPAKREKHKGTPEHNSWAAMKQRCYYVGHKQFPDYGGRGIKVCDRWLGRDGFKHFLEDMGPKPGPQYSLDRIDNDGPYSPDNCRWADRWEQNGNRRWKNKSTGINGVRKFNEKYWIADITVNGQYHCKYTKTKEEAILWRRKLENRFIPKYRH